MTYTMKNVFEQLDKRLEMDGVGYKYGHTAEEIRERWLGEKFWPCFPQEGGEENSLPKDIKDLYREWISTYRKDLEGIPFVVRECSLYFQSIGLRLVPEDLKGIGEIFAKRLGYGQIGWCTVSQNDYKNITGDCIRDSFHSRCDTIFSKNGTEILLNNKIRRQRSIGKRKFGIDGEFAGYKDVYRVTPRAYEHSFGNCTEFGSRSIFYKVPHRKGTESNNKYCDKVNKLVIHPDEVKIFIDKMGLKDEIEITSKKEESKAVAEKCLDAIIGLGLLGILAGIIYWASNTCASC